MENQEQKLNEIKKCLTKTIIHITITSEKRILVKT